ncbi:MAG: hypothetical protein HY262_05425 [Chloroflexi bacterium]|nr:hypothetical protein [Chloroflexota bacterium]
MSDLRARGWARRRAMSAGVASVLLVASGCGSAAPTPAPPGTPLPTVAPSISPAPSATPAVSPPAASADAGAIYDAIEQQVIQIRGLRPSRPVPRQSIDQAELRTMMTGEFDRQSPPDYVAANERLYKALGLIPADSNLRDLTLDMLSGGVVGFYRNDQGKLYVVSKTGLPGVGERITFAHEFDHALQDQNFAVFKDQDGILDQSDRLLARQAVFEGDATLLMTLWAAAHFGPADMLAYLALSADPAAQAVLQRTPPFLRDLLLYPYTTGLSFVQATQLRDGWAGVDSLYRRMPVSTEQILHPEKYAADESPIRVDLPADLAAELGSGWTVPLEDTFGELELDYWLRESGVKPATATSAAAGWGGDRLAVARGPSGAWGVVIDTAWDTAADASEFADAANQAIAGLANPARVSSPAGTHVTVLVASSQDALLALDVIFGATGV